MIEKKGPKTMTFFFNRDTDGENSSLKLLEVLFFSCLGGGWGWVTSMTFVVVKVVKRKNHRISAAHTVDG